MKYINKITIVLFLISFSCSAQSNKLTDDELFEGMKFNNVSLSDIMNSSGNLRIMRTLFGTEIQEKVNVSSPYKAKFLYNNSISFGFEDESDSGNNFDLTYIDVKNSSVLVKVNEMNIKLGDDKSKFGNLIVNSKTNSFDFIDRDTGNISLIFYIDYLTNKVNKIKLIVY